MKVSQILMKLTNCQTLLVDFYHHYIFYNVVGKQNLFSFVVQQLKYIL